MRGAAIWRDKAQPFAGISADEATQKLVQLFRELGFLPEAVEDSDERKVLLHRCPFREVAESNQQVVCAVHLGMLRGALNEMGAPLEAILPDTAADDSASRMFGAGRGSRAVCR